MPWTSSRGKCATWAAPIFEATGRALFAAQEFENRCRVLLRFLNLVEIYDSATDDPFDSLIARVPKDKLLGKTIEDLRIHAEFNNEDTAEKLRAAKDVRNFIGVELVVRGSTYEEGIPELSSRQGKTAHDSVVSNAPA